MGGRYGVQRGWEHNSALEAYDGVHEPNYRVGAAYDDRRYIDDRFPGDSSYSRGAFNRDVERDSYAASPPAGLWPQTRRRDYEEEYPLDRESRKHDRSYVEPYDEIDDVHGNHRFGRYGMRDRDDYVYDNYEYKHRRDSSHDRDYDYGRRSHDSDYDRSRRDGSWRRHDSRDRDRDRGRDRDRREVNHERDLSPYRRRDHSRSRSRSRGRDDRSKSRSPRSRSRGRSRSHREDSYEDRYDKPERRRDREEKRRDHYSVAPSATVVIKGLSPNTTEEDLHQFLAEWGPIRNVRVIKERDSGLSRGFAFLDFHSVDAAQAMMNKVGVEGLVVDGRKLLFEYSSKPTGVSGGSSYGQDGPRSSHGSHRNTTMPSDWMCTICGCVNFARRVSCFQCNESRTNDAPAADVSSSHASSGRKGFEAGPTHVLVVRGLDENADEEMLRYEFSKHAPIKDLRLVRDKFTHVSRGFAFVHFYSVEDATKALDATNGTTLERNGQILRVAYAKSVFGPGGPSGYSQSSSLAAAAIEAAAFSQQYDAVGWAPKEYNADDKPVGGQEQGSEVAGQKEGSAPQSGFVWDETSGYYYDAASGFYYDPNTGLYYDGNNGVWYTFDNKTQQYVPCTDQNANTKSEKESEAPKTENNTARKVVISAPAATISSSEKPASLPDAVQAAASAALAAEKREKEKAKEIKLAAKSSILANKKKMSNVLSMWKQRSHEGQTPRVALDDGQTPATADDRPSSATSSLKPKVAVVKDTANIGSGFLATTPSTQALVSESESKSWPANNSSKGTLMGVIRGSGRGVVKSDTVYSGTTAGPSAPSSLTTSAVSSAAYSDAQGGGTASFKTDVSALGGYTPPTASGGRRRFSETPMQPVSGQREQNQTSYRDRAAERRRMYGSSSSYVDDGLEAEDPNDGVRLRKVSSELGAMPFPPGVGGRGPADSVAQTYDVITPDKAIDESNVGNRMLRNMGWTDGSGLGRDGSGMVEPVQAQAFDNRAGLGTQPKKADPTLEVHPGDSYKTLIQKKALQRFREMS